MGLSQSRPVSRSLDPIVGRQRPEGSHADEICPICLDEAASHRFGDACVHCFCVRCLERCAISGHNFCPMCRATRRQIVLTKCTRCRTGALLVGGHCPICDRHGISHAGRPDAEDARTQQEDTRTQQEEHAQAPAQRGLNAARSTPASDAQWRTVPWEQQLSGLSPALQSHGMSSSGATCVFDSSRDGISLQLLRRRLLDVDAAILLVTCTSGDIVGSFTGFNWQMPSIRSYGTQASFMFRLPGSQSGNNSPQIWHATERNSFFMYSKPDFVAFGLSDEGFGFQLDADLRTMTSARTETFGNPALGELAVEKVVALSWRIGATFEMDVGTTGEEARAIGRALLALGGRQTMEQDYFG